MNRKQRTEIHNPRFFKLRDSFLLQEEESYPISSRKTFDLSTSENKILTTFCIVSAFLCLQLAMSLNSYSGESKPLMYGDYEAQRHWMEITYNLPIEQWYVNGTHNNLLYWGLDYPPLTAYHHYILGALANKINKNWVELKTSHGYESTNHKLFMRLSAIIPFYIFYLPSLIYFLSSTKNVTPLIYALALFYPSIIFMDNGHFQYNSISLGLFLATYVFLTKNYIISGSIFYVAALNYKQMELYHSLPVFVFILSRSIKKGQLFNSFFNVLKIGAVVITSFIIIWMPFLLTNTAKDVLIRIFPFNRGLYEDKVASFWCAFSFILKRLPIQNLHIYLSTTCVLLCSAPSLVSLFLHPSDRNFRISLFATSLSFFLFSYHVHEKTILLASIPALLLISEYTNEVLWFLSVTNISIFSLCVKDDLTLAIILFISYSIVAYSCLSSKKTEFTISNIFGFSICILELYGPSIKMFPQIYQLANALFCCIHFLYFLVFSSVLMFPKEKKE